MHHKPFDGRVVCSSKKFFKSFGPVPLLVIAVASSTSFSILLFEAASVAESSSEHVKDWKIGVIYLFTKSKQT